MICNNNYLTEILRVCEIKDLIWVMLFQSPLVYFIMFLKTYKRNFQSYKLPLIDCGSDSWGSTSITNIERINTEKCSTHNLKS